MVPNDSQAAERFAKACADARAHLWRLMEANGLHERDGWKILETMREGARGLELVMRPLHLRKPAPPDIECIVAIDESSSTVDTNCSP